MKSQLIKCRKCKEYTAVIFTREFRKNGCKCPHCGYEGKFENGIVLDPFGGSFTTALVARKLGRNFLSCDLSADYVKIGEKRLAQQILI